MILKKVPFATYPIAPTRIVKMKLVKTLGFKDFDLAPNTIDIYYTTRNEQTNKKQYIKTFFKKKAYYIQRFTIYIFLKKVHYDKTFLNKKAYYKKSSL